MSYTVDNHDAFSRRTQNLMLRLQAVREEAAALVNIYQNESLSGAESEFTDTPIALESEHVDAVLFFQSLEAFIANGVVATTDREQWMTPVLQTAP